MNFFEHQDAARRQTGRLVLLFALAVLSIMMATYVVVAVLLVSAGEMTGSESVIEMLLDWRTMGLVGGGVLLVVGGASMYRLLSLRQGGVIVAELLGGRRILPDAQDPMQQRVLNIIEEMAIAAGTPVPPLYIMYSEQGINAFAAGYTPSDAVIGVTRGCAERLSRDELQGVIAHEFSHILNGDMRLNIRLIGVLHGILFIGMIGYFIIRTMFYAGAMGGRAGRRKESGGGVIGFVALGAALVAIGFIGTLFGNLIKAAVSRQREYLADASAVQFTRNPHGIAGALKKIGGFSAGSSVDSPNAPEASHMFFSKALTSGIQSWFATHPPLPDRIRRINPNWQGRFDPASSVLVSAGDYRAGMMGIAEQHAGLTGERGQLINSLKSSVSTVGQISEEQIDVATGILNAIPIVLLNAAREPYGARTVVYCLLINSDEEVRSRQLKRLAEEADPGVFELTHKLLGSSTALDRDLRLPLLDVAIPALRALSSAQYGVFKRNVIELVRADNQMDLFEWMMQRMLLRHVQPMYQRVHPSRVRFTQLSQVSHALQCTFSALAWVGHQTDDEARLAFVEATNSVSLASIDLLDRASCSFPALDTALEQLEQLAPLLKRDVLNACAACMEADRRVTAAEAELFRAIADSIGCPVPPIAATSM